LLTISTVAQASRVKLVTEIGIGGVDEASLAVDALAEGRFD
jgi:hypothetical protein